MVFLDLSKHSQDPIGDDKPSQRIAPVSDRLLAFFFDICLFSPFFTLLLSQIFRKIELRYYTDPGGLEFTVLLALGIFGVAVLTLLAQSVCLWRWGATPGKYFFKMKVVSLSGKAVTFPQAFLRSSIWILEFLTFGLAFFEIFSQKHRRPLHDRAADTMVVTLKLEADLGPHPFEAHFIRNLILIFSTMAFLWGIILVSSFYRMAARGEFRRAELEEHEFMCSAVSDKLEKGQRRLDLATAQFIAGEIEDDCLTSEADFALWTEDKTQQAWGYFAKAIFYQFDDKKSAQYFKKVCEAETDSEPCRLAMALQTQDRSEILKNSESLVSQILQVRELSNQGDFTSALHTLSGLNAVSAGFEKYSQKQTVKFLWALNRKEAASGAYMNAWKFFGPQDQADLAAWMCLEQVGDRCENRNYQPCNDLKASLQENAYSSVTSEAVIGLVMENECKKSHALQLLSFHRILEENDSLRDLVLALSSESDWSLERRLDTLRHLSFDENSSASRVVQKRAQMALLQKSTDPTDAVRLLSLLRGNKKHDWAWHSLMQKITGLAGRSGYVLLSKEMTKDQPQLKSKIKDQERKPAGETPP